MPGSGGACRCGRRGRPGRREWSGTEEELLAKMPWRPPAKVKRTALESGMSGRAAKRTRRRPRRRGGVAVQDEAQALAAHFGDDVGQAGARGGAGRSGLRAGRAGAGWQGRPIRAARLVGSCSGGNSRAQSARTRRRSRSSPAGRVKVAAARLASPPRGRSATSMRGWALRAGFEKRDGEGGPEGERGAVGGLEARGGGGALRGWRRSRWRRCSVRFAGGRVADEAGPIEDEADRAVAQRDAVEDLGQISEVDRGLGGDWVDVDGGAEDDAAEVVGAGGGGYRDQQAVGATFVGTGEVDGGVGFRADGDPERLGAGAEGDAGKAEARVGRAGGGGGVGLGAGGGGGEVGGEARRQGEAEGWRGWAQRRRWRARGRRVQRCLRRRRSCRPAGSGRRRPRSPRRLRRSRCR